MPLALVDHIYLLVSDMASFTLYTAEHLANNSNNKSELVSVLLLGHMNAVSSTSTFVDDEGINGDELPLCLAAGYGRTYIMELLLEFGAYFNAAQHRPSLYQRRTSAKGQEGKGRLPCQ